MVFSIEIHMAKTWNKISMFEHRYWLDVVHILDFGKNHTRTPSKRNAMAFLQLDIVQCSNYMVFSTEMHMTKTRNKISMCGHRYWLDVERILDFGRNHTRTPRKRNAMSLSQLDIAAGFKHMVFSTEAHMTKTETYISMLAHRYWLYVTRVRMTPTVILNFRIFASRSREMVKTYTFWAFQHFSDEEGYVFIYIYICLRCWVCM